MCNKYTKPNTQKDSALRDSVRCAKSGSHTNTAITGQNAIVSSLVPVRVDDEACFTAAILVALQAMVRGGLVPDACKCIVNVIKEAAKTYTFHNFCPQIHANLGDSISKYQQEKHVTYNHQLFALQVSFICKYLIPLTHPKRWNPVHPHTPRRVSVHIIKNVSQDKIFTTLPSPMKASCLATPATWK